MGIAEEFGVFISSICTGIFLCSIYGALRIFRRLISHSLFWISVEDLVYWIGFGIYVFLELHRTCSGRIRWYYLIGMGLGIWISGNIIFKFIKNRIDKSKKTR